MWGHFSDIPFVFYHISFMIFFEDDEDEFFKSISKSHKKLPTQW